jgi:hypothetical protein
MNNKSVLLKKDVTVGEDYFRVCIQINTNEIKHWSEDISIIIEKFNDKNLSYIYKTSGSQNRYIEAIQEAIQKFIEDEYIQKLIKWEGKLKYKIVE